MTPTDHKAVLRALAALDGCQASKKAADHIEYIERQLTSARDYQERLRRKLGKARRQRDELKRQLTGVENDRSAVICADYCGDAVDGPGGHFDGCGADLELV